MSNLNNLKHSLGKNSQGGAHPLGNKAPKHPLVSSGSLAPVAKQVASGTPATMATLAKGIPRDTGC